MRKTRCDLTTKESELRGEHMLEIACHLKTPLAVALQKYGTRPRHLIQDLDSRDQVIEYQISAALLVLTLEERGLYWLDTVALSGKSHGRYPSTRHPPTLILERVLVCYSSDLRAVRG